MIFKIKINIIVLLLMLLFAHEKANAQIKESNSNIINKNTLSADLLSFSYARNFIVNETWAFGTEVSIGIWGGRYALTPLHYTYCEQGCTTEYTNFIGEMFKIKPYIRVNYYKNNYLDIGLNMSYTMLKPIFLDNYGTGTLNFGSGLDVLIVYGWDKVKLGTGLQANIIGKYDSKTTVKVSDQQFAFLWTPIKVIILF